RPGRRERTATQRTGSRPASDKRTGSQPASDKRTGSQRTGDKRAPSQPATSQRSGGKPLDQARRAPDPQVPDEISWYDLDAGARRELQSLPKELAERVGGHLAAAGVTIDDEPELAYAHAATARRLASRVAITREALGLAAYAVGKFDQALAELRAYRRLSGDESHLPLVADCERGLGRPVRAIELASSPAASKLDADGVRELRLVVAGARSDMGQPDAALLMLEQDKALGGEEVTESLVRLRYAYADALLASGRADEARQWMTTVAEQDAAELTDAKQRSMGWQQTLSGDEG
ncbi:MAG: hypothetical protein ABI586_01730, partial [Candidatus Nanopelagicales bacterium]